jgi:hypothetical protein
MKNTLNKLLGLIGVVVFTAVVGIGLLFWQFNRPPFSLSRLEQLHTTMRTNDVQRVLGSPTSVSTRTNESGQAYCAWAYSRPMSWPIVYVYFSPEGQFRRHEYDY